MPTGVDLGAIYASIKLDTSGLTQGWLTARRAMQEGGSYVTKHLAEIEQAGRRMSMSITAPLVAAGATSAKFAIAFEDSMAKIVGLAGGAADEIDGLKQSVLGLSPQVARSPQELADALYFVYSSGVQGQGALDILTQSAKAAAAGLGATQVIADVATSAVNAYGQANITAAQVTDILTAAVREGKGEADAMAGSIGRVLPIAAQMGVDFANVAAAMATMTRSGLDTDEAATALRGTLAALLNPAKQTVDALESVGLTAEGVRRELSENLIAGLAHLAQAFKGNDELLAQVFPNIRALIGVLNLTGQSAEQVAEIFDAVRNSTGATDSAFKAMEETVGFKLRQSLEKLQVAAIQLGDAMGPAIQAISRVIGGLADAMLRLGPAGSTMALTIGGIVASIGPLLVAIASVKTALTTLGVASATLSTVFSGPVLLAIGAVAAAITGLIALYKALHHDTVAEANAAAENARSKYEQAQETAKLVAETQRLADNHHRSAAESKLYHENLQKIAQLNPSLISGFDKMGNAIGLTADALHKANIEAAQFMKNWRATELAKIDAEIAGLKEQLKYAQDTAKTRAEALHTGKKPVDAAIGFTGSQIVYGPLTREDQKRYLADLKKTNAEIDELNKQLAVKAKERKDILAGVMPGTGAALAPRPSPAPTPSPAPAGGGGPARGGVAARQKTPAEIASEAARDAMNWLQNMKTLGRLSEAEYEAGLKRIAAKKGQYAKIDLATEAQVAAELKRIADERTRRAEEAERQRAAEAAQAAQDIIDVENAVAQAQRESDEAVRRYEQEREAAQRKELEDSLRRLDYDRAHNHISLADYIATLQAKQAALEQYSDQWMMLQSKIDAATADQAQAQIDAALDVAETNKQAGLQMLQDALVTYEAMGDAGVEACRRIQEAIDQLQKKKESDRQDTISWSRAWIQEIMNIADSFANALADMIMGTGNFKDFLRRTFHEALRFVIDFFLKQVLESHLAHKKMQADAAKTAAANAAAGAAGGGGGKGVFGFIPMIVPFLFDDPINDTAAVRSGADFARLFRQGALADLGRAMPDTRSMVQPAPVQQTIVQHNEKVQVTTTIDKVTNIADIERLSEAQAWIIARKLNLVPTG